MPEPAADPLHSRGCGAPTPAGMRASLFVAKMSLLFPLLFRCYPAVFSLLFAAGIEENQRRSPDGVSFQK
jgi:hypothetical protein